MTRSAARAAERCPRSRRTHRRGGCCAKRSVLAATFACCRSGCLRSGTSPSPSFRGDYRTRREMSTVPSASLPSVGTRVPRAAHPAVARDTAKTAKVGLFAATAAFLVLCAKSRTSQRQNLHATETRMPLTGTLAAPFPELGSIRRALLARAPWHAADLRIDRLSPARRRAGAAHVQRVPAGTAVVTTHTRCAGRGSSFRPGRIRRHDPRSSPRTSADRPFEPGRTSRRTGPRSSRQRRRLP